MPIHPDVAARFHYLNGLPSLREAYGDPVLIQQIRQFETWDTETGPPAVHTRSQSAPGPHGPVPVRIYTPTEDLPAGAPGLVWLHGGGFIGGDLDMREADWTARAVCAAAGSPFSGRLTACAGRRGPGLRAAGGHGRFPASARLRGQRAPVR